MAKPRGKLKDDLTPFAKSRRKDTMKTLGLSKPKVDTSAQDEIAEQQRLMQADLDEEENRKRKQLLSAAQGIRAYSGSPLFRAAPSNKAGRAAPSAAAGANAGRFVAGGGIRSNRGAIRFP